MKSDPARFRDMSNEYNVVAEMLEYFEHYKLATWAPLAEIIKRERSHREASTAKLEADIRLLISALERMRGVCNASLANRLVNEALTRIQGEYSCGGGNG